MAYLFLVAFIAGLLLAVRIMFFGAERRSVPASGATPLRRSEPAIVGFLIMFGVAGYLLTRRGTVTLPMGVLMAFLLGIAWAAIVAWLALLTARVKPEHDPDDPRYALQGHVAVVTAPILFNGEGTIRYAGHGVPKTLRARSIDDGAIPNGTEVCIDRVVDGIAFVEPWALVEARL